MAHNCGNKETLHVGSFDTGEEVLTRLEKDRSAQRISLGLFFNF